MSVFYPCLFRLYVAFIVAVACSSFLSLPVVAWAQDSVGSEVIFKVRGPEFLGAEGYTISGISNEIVKGNNFSKIWRADGPAGNIFFQAEAKNNTLTYTMSGELDTNKSPLDKFVNHLGFESQLDDVAYFPRLNDPHLKVST